MSPFPMRSEVTQDVLQKSIKTRRRESVGALLKFQEGQGAWKCFLEFHWETKDQANIFNVFCCWILAFWFFLLKFSKPFYLSFSSKIEKQFLSLLEDVRDPVVLMTQKAHSIHVRPGDKMASWWCPQRKPAPAESYPFGPWPLFLFQAINSSPFPHTTFPLSVSHLVGKLFMPSFST